MDLYDQLADVTGTKYANYLLTKDEVLAREPQLKSEGLQGGGVYLDYRNNDARLVIENIKQAVADGAHAVSRVQAVGFLYNDEGKITGIQAKDLLTDEKFEIHADVVINTTGPWSDKLINYTPWLQEPFSQKNRQFSRHYLLFFLHLHSLQPSLLSELLG